jgi:hypothetical protein
VAELLRLCDNSPFPADGPEFQQVGRNPRYQKALRGTAARIPSRRSAHREWLTLFWLHISIFSKPSIAIDVLLWEYAPAATQVHLFAPVQVQRE